ncbi:hypothetical protein [Papillibacter cinnamivorans]|nr:hypothetical protein [Papillibacter cinnamivorans]
MKNGFSGMSGKTAVYTIIQCRIKKDSMVVEKASQNFAAGAAK